MLIMFAIFLQCVLIQRHLCETDECLVYVQMVERDLYAYDCLCMIVHVCLHDAFELSLHAQDQWSSYGTMEPDCATAIKNGSRKMGEMKLGMNSHESLQENGQTICTCRPLLSTQWVSTTFH